MRILLFIFSFMAFASPVAYSQSLNRSAGADDDDDPFEKKSYFMCGLNYLSNNVYLGRKDTFVIPYYSPYIGYHDKSGIYVKGMASYTNAQGNGHIDLATLEAGYDHTFGNFNGGVDYNRFFYNKNSLSIRANTKSCIGVNGQFNNEYIEPEVTFDANFNKSSTDYVLGTKLDHNFQFINNLLQITPAILLNTGTQNYYDEYFKARITKNDKKAKPKKVVADASEFKPLDYEFSIKTTYRAGKWLFSLTPTYAIPTSPSSITLPNRVVQEKLSNSFYLELDICHR